VNNADRGATFHLWLPRVGAGDALGITAPSEAHGIPAAV
jgi:hypothetical protein